ncbi:MAD2 mitotic arrest deficient-like 2 [Dimargaris cristalligena]|uniref:DNA-binding protein n=1 Tax=Dimargaris cristalligena TaxID=215637 RepID=A0A4Q0A151_9FUNG|nr:MAD2 mitotic arrest deficient-like 2 [Dimargaris cristalligena]RKP39478.1 DNA-binding protein [Dimargaris cristalligena]|eukprot:RKP39478.1 DNA-binding protein [Dimargaris cristalligena]
MTAGQPPSGTVATDGQLLNDFVEALVHQVIYSRHIYPPTLFEKKNRYGIPVFMSRHPALNSYISHSIKDVDRLVKTGVLNKLFIMILDSNERTLERITLEISQWDVRSANRSPEILITSFRSVLLRAQLCDTKLSEIPPGMSPYQQL